MPRNQLGRFILSSLLTSLLLTSLSFAQEAATDAPTDPEANWRTTTENVEMRKQWNAAELSQVSLSGLKFLDEKFDPATIKNKVVVLAFWSTSSPASIEALDKLKDVVAEFSDSNVLIAVHITSGWGKMKDVATPKAWPFIVAADAKGDLTTKLKPGKLPRLYVIDRKGFLRVASADPAALLDILRVIENEPYTTEGYPKYLERKLEKGNDFQGKPAPKLDGLEWLNAKPNLKGKVILLSLFDPGWRSSPDQAQLLSDLQKKYKDDLAIIGMGIWEPSKMSAFMREATIEYTIGTEANGAVEQAIAPPESEYRLVISSDGIVRWQGPISQYDTFKVTSVIESDPGVALRRLKDRKAKIEENKKAQKATK